ncbi:MAG: cohesin domain-containing protein, partial [Desulfocucumaceae bacterium]
MQQTQASGRWMLIIALVLALTLCAGVFSAGAAVPQADLGASDVTGHPGELVSAPVTMTSSVDVKGIQFEFNYDDQVLEFMGVASGDLPSGFSVTAGTTTNRVIIVHNGGITIPAGTTVVASLQFSIKNSANPCDRSDVSLDSVILADTDLAKIEPVSVDNGSIAVIGTMSLTVNDPGVIKVGETAQLDPVTVPDVGSVFGFVSDNPAVATVDQSGLINGVCNGTANITVTASKECYDDAAPYIVAVIVEKGDIAVTPVDPKTLKAGETWDIPPVSNLEGVTFTYQSD